MFVCNCRLLIILGAVGSIWGFGVSVQNSNLNVPCGTGNNAVIGNLTVQKPFWPITWTIAYLGGDPTDATKYISINNINGEIRTKTSKPPIFTQQVLKIDGEDASGSRNKVSAYLVIKWPQCR